MLLNILFLFQAGTASFLCFACWLFLPFLLGIGLGYWIWGAYKSLVEERNLKIAGLQKTISDNEQEQIDLKYKLESADTLSTKLKGSLSEVESENRSLHNRLKLAENTTSETIITEEVVEAASPVIEASPIEVVEEVTTSSAKPLAIASATAATAVAATTIAPASDDDKEDDYLPCKEYLGHKVNDKRNNIALFKHKNKQYYFALYAADGSVRLRSEGFSRSQLRDKELSGVVRFKDNPEMYKRVQKGKYYMEVLFDQTGREVGRSCLQKEATPVPTAAKEIAVPEQAPVKVAETEVVDRQIIKVKRTVNISGLEDLDGIDATSQRKLIDLGFGSMTALAAASQTDLASRFAGTGLNWKHWWNQSRYATNGDWAKFYALQNNPSSETTINSTAAPEQKTLSTLDRSLDPDLAPVHATPNTRTLSKQNQYQIYFNNDNLQIIEGVGPKIEKILKGAGYGTWGILANASYNDLKKVMSDAGPRYRIHNPKSWSKQAQLANDSKWEELINYQKFLENTIGTDSAYSKVEKLLNKNLGFSNSEIDDLKIIEGVGPKIEGLLKAGGINTWKDLSNASVDKLKLILLNAGNRYRLADPSTWPIQAGMANRREWTKLKEYQDLLQGGKRIS